MKENNKIKKQSKIGTLFKYFLWDMVLMIVLIINLLLITWDWVYSIPSVNEYFIENFPNFSDFYQFVHVNIRAVDLIFVSIYILDLLIGWSISMFIKKEKFYRYPFTHWYDVLGCIPSGSLVFFRLLRVVSIMIRLHKKRIIDIRKLWLVKQLIGLYNIVMEEISDRVVLNILYGIKQNIGSGMPITNMVFQKIILPQKQKIIDLVFKNIKAIASHEYTLYKGDIAKYVKEKSKEAIDNNKELSRLKLIPVVGGQIKETIEKSVSDTIVKVVDNVFEDVISDSGQEKLKTVATEVADKVLEDLQNDLQPIFTDIVVSVVEIIAKTANVKQWKLAEIRSKIMKVKNSANPDEKLIEKLESEYHNLIINELDKTWEYNTFK